MKKWGPTSVRKVFLRASFYNLFAYESLLLTSTSMMSILQSSPGNITSIAKVWTSARNVFVRALLLMKACSSWWSNLGQVCANLQAFLGHILLHLGAFRPMLGLSLSLLVEVCWKWLGPWGLDQGYVEGFAAVMSLVLQTCWSTWLLFLWRLTWAGGPLRSACKTQKKTWKVRSDKCKKGLDSFLCRFCCFVLWKLAPVGGQIRGTFVPIFGDLGAFLGHILFHIGALQRMLGLSWGFSWRYVGSDWGRGV